MSSRSSYPRWRAASFLTALAGLCLLAGCSASHYRKAADKEVYHIIERAEGATLGQTNAFTIDTPYSARKPAEILPPELIEDRLQSNRRVLTIEGALGLAVTQSRRYQDSKELLYLTALTLSGQRYEFGAQFFALATAQWNRGTKEKAGNVERTVQDDSIKSRVGVAQLLESGGGLGVTLANDLLNYATGDSGHSIINTISVNLAQPLLRGFGRNNPAVEQLRQDERDVIYAVRNYSFFQEEFALEIVNDYFGLLGRKDAIRNRYANYLSRGLSARRLEARGQDRERLSDVDQARQAELKARNDYVDELARFETELDAFKIKLGLPVAVKVSLDDAALVEVRQAGLVPASLRPREAYLLAVQKQLPVLNAIDKFEDSKRKIRVAADALKPGLDLFADASLQSDPHPDYTKFDPDNLHARVGIALNLPINRVRERNDYRATLVKFEANLRGLTLTLDTLRERIDRGVRTLEQRRQNHQIQTNALALANRRVASTTLFVQAGLNPVRDLLEAQDAQISAQNAVTEAIVNYQEARLQLMLDIGALKTGKPKFWLQDHLAGFLQEPPPEPPAAMADKPLVPPDEFFNQ